MPKRDLPLENDQEHTSGVVKKRNTDYNDTRTESSKQTPLAHDAYMVGWICAISTEYVAAQAVLDEQHERPEYSSLNDNNDYTLGRIGKHNVVLAVLPDGEYGISSASTVARDMLHTFPNIRIGLMVGIGGGAPSRKNDIRLGDIVVSAPRDGNGGGLQYDYGKTIQHQTFQCTGFLNQPPPSLRTAVSGIKAQYEINGHELKEEINGILKERPRLRKKYQRPDQTSDRLYQSSVVHPTGEARCADACGDDPSKLILRHERTEDDDNPTIHYGLIASANQLMKDATVRDKLAAEKGVLCFEMEAAGLMNHFPCLIIRGICDYADTHKNKNWQGYAALAAAAYAKDLLCRILPNKVEAESKISELIYDVHNKISRMDSKLNKIEDIKIFKWLSALNPHSRHFESQERRVNGTGRWMLEDPKFVQWSSEAPNCKTLCCYGAAGAGKTIISSLVIDKLEECVMAVGSKVGLAYVYCDYRDQGEQTVENILGAVIKQLLQHLPRMPEAVSKLYEERVAREKPLSLSDAVKLLRVACAQFSKVYVCLDALDEVGKLRDLLEKLRESPSSMQIFVTGRDHIRRNVQDYLKEDNCISIEAQGNDIQLFIEHEIGGVNDVEPEAMDERLRKNILTKVVESAEGMFLLPTLQMRTVLQAATIRDREEALKTLPSNLDEAFSGTMSRIEQQPSALSNKAGMIIAWIHLAERPLTVDELLCSLAIRDRDKSLDVRGVPVRESLLNCCQGLAQVDQETLTVRLVHYSLQEYLSRRDKIFGHSKATWHSKIARTCLTFLKFPSKRAEAAVDPSTETVTLLFYAATQWGHHLRKGNDSAERPMELAEEYLCNEIASKPEHLRLLYHAMCPYNESLLNGFLPAHITAFFGIPEITSYLILSGKLLLESNADIETKDGGGWTPLMWAAVNGHEAVVKLLLENNADIETKDGDRRTPLTWAAESGHEAVVKLLQQFRTS